MSFFLSSQGIRIQQEPASFAARLAASIIDFLLMSLGWYLLFKLSYSGLFDGVNEILLSVLSFLIPYLYPLIYETSASGQTIGKKILHIRVVTLDGGGPKMTSFILRWLLLLFDIFFAFGIGQLCVFFTKRQQRLGDLIAGTWVVRTQEYTKTDFNSL